MKRLVLIFSAGLLGAVLLMSLPALTADTTAQELFNKLRKRILDNAERVPRYTCVETVTRTQYHPQYGNRPNTCPALVTARDALESPGPVVWHDRLRLDVAVGEQSEIFSWAGAKQFESGNLQDLAASGSTGSGDFGAFLGSVFGGDAQGFRYLGEKAIPLGRLAAFEYVVPLRKSHYSYRTGTGADGTVAYHGAFYAVPETGELKRLVVDADDFPSGDVCRVHDTMDYSTKKIGSGDFLLPDVSTMEVLYRNGEESKNQTHYSGCHEFTGETTIRFDDGDEPTSPANVAKAELKALPAGTRIRVKIDPPVDTAVAAAGDPITAVVERDVKLKGQTLVRTTDRLRGRLLRLEQFAVPLPYWIVAIRFEAIERDGVEQAVSFRPLDDGERSAIWAARGRRVPMEVPARPAGAGVFLFGEAGNLVLDGKFHSEWATK